MTIYLQIHLKIIYTHYIQFDELNHNNTFFYKNKAVTILMSGYHIGDQIAIPKPVLATVPK